MAGRFRWPVHICGDRGVCFSAAVVELGAEQRTLLARMALLSYGQVQRFGGRGGGESGRVGPPGEAHPLHDRWAREFAGAPTPEALAELTEAAHFDYDTAKRRLLAPDTTETWEELAARIVADGWGLPADDCALAMRCTPTMVRRARLAELRHPESGYSLPVEPDRIAWAKLLDDAGLTLRQIEAVTGVSKSSVHRLRTRNGGPPPGADGFRSGRRAGANATARR